MADTYGYPGMAAAKGKARKVLSPEQRARRTRRQELAKAGLISSADSRELTAADVAVLRGGGGLPSHNEMLKKVKAQRQASGLAYQQSQGGGGQQQPGGFTNVGGPKKRKKGGVAGGKPTAGGSVRSGQRFF